jgi:serine/threonine protein kinase
MRVYLQLLEVARALEYLHSLLIVHGDIKLVGSPRFSCFVCLSDSWLLRQMSSLTQIITLVSPTSVSA